MCVLEVHEVVRVRVRTCVRTYVPRHTSKAVCCSLPFCKLLQGSRKQIYNQLLRGTTCLARVCGRRARSPHVECLFGRDLAIIAAISMACRSNLPACTSPAAELEKNKTQAPACCSVAQRAVLHNPLCPTTATATAAARPLGLPSTGRCLVNRPPSPHRDAAAAPSPPAACATLCSASHSAVAVSSRRGYRWFPVSSTFASRAPAMDLPPGATGADTLVCSGGCIATLQYTCPS
jgi:hypothetical protein